MANGTIKVLLIVEGQFEKNVPSLIGVTKLCLRIYWLLLVLVGPSVFLLKFTELGIFLSNFLIKYFVILPG